MVIDELQRRVARALAIISAVLLISAGAMVLAGWILDISVLKQLFTRAGVTMKGNTAIGLLLAGVSLLCLVRPGARSWRLLGGRAAAAIVLAIGALTAIEHLTGFNFRIDEAIFREPPGALFTTSPGRMGPPASLSLTLAGLALLILEVRVRGRRSPAQWLACAILIIAVLPLLGYMVGATQLFGIARLTGIAPHTSLCLLVLGTGLLVARPEARPISILFADNLGGQMARRLLPAAIFVPIILGYLRTIGEQRGYYDTPFGRALLLLTIMVVFTSMVWLTANRLSNVAIARDVAEQTRAYVADQARRLSEEKLETLSLLDSLLANAPIGLAFFDRQLRYLRANEYLARINGMPVASHANQSVQQIVPAGAVPVIAALEKVFATGQPVAGLEVTGPPSPESQIQRSWLVGLFPVRDSKNNVSSVGAILIEITERKKLEQQLAGLLDSERAARSEAEHALRLKDEFLATLSHELRTPLNAILGWASILRMNPSTAPNDLHSGLETIERNAKIQAQLIEDLLDVSRIISGKMRLDVQAVDLPTVVEQALAAVLPAVRAKNIRIQKQLDPRAEPVMGDPARLQQIVWNLLANAVKFTPKDGAIQIALQRVNSQVELSIADNGIGIDRNFLPHLFERFRQADASPSRRHGGLGLGLALVKQLTELHGGTVTAFSDGLDRGSTFVVKLPLSALRETTVESYQIDPAGREEHKERSARLSSVRVLVVDDEPDARELVRKVLEQYGAEVHVAASVSEALEAMQQFQPQILVSDIGMPERDGYDLIRDVRKQMDARDVPAIALTAFARPEDRRRTLLAGYQLHIAKPVDPHELSAAVASLAGRTGGNNSA